MSLPLHSIQRSSLTLLLLPLGALVLSLPAWWNGYPLLFYDSVDYIAASFTHQPAVYRTLPYSLFVGLTHAGASLWGTVLAQGLILAYLLLEAAFAFAPGAPRRAFGVSLVVLTLGSGLPWFSSQVMPDFFTGAMVLGLALLALAPLPLARLILVWLLTVTAIAAHASHLATALALGLGIPLLVRGGGRSYAVRGWLPAAAIAVGVLATPVVHRILSGELYLSRSAPIMALARLIRDGEAQRYLSEVCPQAGFLLCDHIEELKSGWDGANQFLWGRGSPFDLIGGWSAWREVGDEARAIVAGAILAHPWYNLRAALRGWGQQLLSFGTGSGLGADIWHVAPLKETVQERFPAEAEALVQARQYRTDLDLSRLSALHRVVLALFMLAGAVQLLRCRRLPSPAAAFLLLVMLAALVNGGVTAVFSNPDDRYQARLVWLFIPALIFLAAQAPQGRAQREEKRNAEAAEETRKRRRSEKRSQGVTSVLCRDGPLGS